MVKDSRPSVLRVIQNDYIALVAFLFPIVCGAMYVLGMFFAKEDWATFIYVVLFVTVGGVLVLLWRYRLILSVFTQGMEVSGTISRVSFFRDRGRIEYVYDWDGETYSGGGRG